jgi:hypothetical protein
MTTSSLQGEVGMVCRGVAPFTQALMLKTSPNRFDHWSDSALPAPTF